MAGYRRLLEKGGTALLAAFLLAAAGLAAFLPRFGVDASTNLLLNEDDPDLGYYNTTRAEWDYDEYAIVCVRRDDWFTPESIKLLAEFSDALLKAPHAKSVTSILTVPLLRNRPAAIPGLPVMTSLSDPKADLAKAREELLQHSLAQGNLISKDGRDLSLLVYVDVPAETLRLDPLWSRAQGAKDSAALRRLAPAYDAALGELRARRTTMIAAVRSIARDWAPKINPNEPVRLSGLPIITVNLVEHVKSDLETFGLASFALFTLSFLLIYRKPRWTALPIATCILPVVLVLGTMAAMDRKVTVITSNLPVLLFTLMLPYTVYFVERYRERRGLYPAETNLDSTAGAASDVWIPCLYSCTTTMAGFASLLTSGINPVRTFGLMMTVGMGVGLACVFLFLPALSRPLRPLDGTARSPAPEPRGAVRAFERFVLGAPGLVVAVSLVLLGVSVWGTAKLKVETKFIDYFRSGSEVYQGLLYIDTRMGGTTPEEVILTAKEPGYFKKAKGLEALAAAAAYFDESKMPVGNVRSFKTLVDEGRKAMKNAKDEAIAATAVAFLGRKWEWTCPGCGPRVEPAAESGEEPRAGDVRKRSCPKCKEEKDWSFVRFQPGLLSEFCSRDFSKARVLVRFKETDPALHRNRILRGLERHLETAVRPLGVEARDTGVFRLYANMLNSLIESQKETSLYVVGAIFAMLLLLFRSLALPAVVLVPQVLPVLVCLGTMGFCGIALDMVTVMIASIAMGVGIDAAIQYTVRYRIELAAAGGDRRAAVTRSHATIGRSIWIATSIVVAGFIVLALSKFVPSVTFGVFTALAMLMGQFAALTLLPALFLLLRVPAATGGGPPPPGRGTPGP